MKDVEQSQEPNNDGELEIVQILSPPIDGNLHYDAAKTTDEFCLCNEDDDDDDADNCDTKENAAFADDTKFLLSSRNQEEDQEKQQQEQQSIASISDLQANEEALASFVGDHNSKDQKERFAETVVRATAKLMEHGEMERSQTKAKEKTKRKNLPNGSLRFFRPKGSSESRHAMETRPPQSAARSSGPFRQDESVVLSEPGAIAVFPSTGFGANGTISNRSNDRQAPAPWASQRPDAEESQSEAHNNHGLVVANLVDEDVLTAADAMDTAQIFKKRRKERLCRIVGLSIMTLAIVVVVVASHVGFQDKAASTSTFETIRKPETSASQTQVPAALSREAYLQSLLPEYLTLLPEAFEWSVLDPYFDNRLDWQIVQRYALAALFFDTNGRQWFDSTNWLSYNHSVCEWFNFNVLYMEEVDYVLPATSRSLCDPRSKSSSVTKTAFDEFSEDETIGEIYLGFNNLQGTLPDALFLLTDLRLVDLSGNQLEGTLSSQLYRPQNLTLLSLAGNSFHGRIPSEIGLASSLGFFHLIRNSFEGTIPTEIGLLKKIEWLLLDDNSFTGNLPTELGLLSSMEILYTDRNSFNSSIPSELGLCSNLIELQMQESRLDHVGGLRGEIPTELGRLRRLRKLRLFQNMLTSTIPSELGQLELLEDLRLNLMSVTGTIPTEIGLLGMLTSLWLNDNPLSGSVPSEIGLVSSLEQFIMDGLFMTGSIPSEVGLLGSLQFVSFFATQVSGSIPSHLGLLSSVERLFLNMCNFTGRIPTELGLLTSAMAIALEGNSLSGELPSFSGAESLQFLDVSHNDINGTLPTSLGQVSMLNYFWASSNQISGPLPSELGLLTLLGSLKLDGNVFQGTIPAEWSALSQAPQVETQSQVNVSRNVLISGTVPSELCSIGVFDCTSLLCGCSCLCS